MIQELIAGGSAGAIGVMIGNPLDVIKVRMQTMPTKYYSVVQSASLIIKHEGTYAFMKGMISPLVAQFFMNAILFSTNSLMMKILEPNRQKHETGHSTNVYISGSIGGLTQCFILVPTDNIKCKLQTDISTRTVHNASSTTATATATSVINQSTVSSSQYNGVIDCAKSIIRKEGIMGLYKGFLPTAMREIPAFGIYFSSYNYMLGLFQYYNNQLYTHHHAHEYDMVLEKKASKQPTYEPSQTAILVSGGIAGCLSWLGMYPIDVIKSNIQISNSSEKATITATAKRLYQLYGWKVFFRGLSITLIRAFPVNAAVFYFYEKFRMHLEFLHTH